MNKREFLTQLRKGLSGLPQEDMAERLTFYSEMIEDRKEEGLSEEEAVAAVGSVQEIVEHAVAETPLTKIAKEKIKPKRRMSAGDRAFGLGLADLAFLGCCRRFRNSLTLRFAVGGGDFPVGRFCGTGRLFGWWGVGGCRFHRRR